MKKNFYSLMALAFATSIFTACDDDDFVEKPRSAQITVRTSALYDAMGVTDLMPSALAGNRIITDTVLIYDAEGQLVRKLGSEVTSLDDQTFVADSLADGDYTLVAWQTTCLNNENATRNWATSAEDQLSTAKILETQKVWYNYFHAVGVGTANVTVRGGNVEATLAPQPMGSIVDIQIDSLVESLGVKYVALCVREKYRGNGFCLDPSVSDDDRWELNDESMKYTVLGNVKQGENSVKAFTMTQGEGAEIILLAVLPDGRSAQITADKQVNITPFGHYNYHYSFYRQNSEPFFGTSEEYDAYLADAFYTRLKALSNVVAVKEGYASPSYGYKEAYRVDFEQPIDHNNPSAGTFRQKAFAFYRGSDRPTVLYTCGYDLDESFMFYPYDDVASSMQANLIMVEHRYYGESAVTTDQRWDYLTCEQAAADHHAIVQSLKSVLPQQWMSTGVSKDGETAMLYRYFYPDDVDLTVPFCAPVVNSLYDSSVGRYLFEKCGTSEERTGMDALMRKMLAGGEDGIYRTFAAKMAETRPDADRSFTQYVFFCFEYFFSFFQYGLPAERQFPALDSSDETLVETMLGDWIAGDYFENNPVKYPYLVQMAKQFGRYEHDYDAYSDLLEGTSFDKETANRYLTPLKPEDQWLLDTYDNTLMKTIREQFLPNTELPFLFVYANDDPWTGAAVTDVNTQYSKIIYNPQGYHSGDINNTKQYSAETCQEILDFIARYISY